MKYLHVFEVFWHSEKSPAKEFIGTVVSARDPSDIVSEGGGRKAYTNVTRMLYHCSTYVAAETQEEAEQVIRQSYPSILHCRVERTTTPPVLVKD